MENINKDELIKELRAENERALQDMKCKLEREFQDKLRLILESLQPNNPDDSPDDKDQPGGRSRTTVSTATGRAINSTADQSASQTKDVKKAKKIAKSDKVPSSSKIKAADPPADVDLARYGPYINSFEQEKQYLTIKGNKKTNKGGELGQSQVSDALALATGANTQPAVAASGDVDNAGANANTINLKLVPTEKEKITERLKQVQRVSSQHEDATSSTAAAHKVANSAPTSGGGSGSGGAGDSGVSDNDEEKHLLSCTRSMLRKTEFLLNESRTLTGGTRRNSGNGNNSSGKTSKKHTAVGKSQSNQSLPKIDQTLDKPSSSNVPSSATDKFPPIRPTSRSSDVDSDRYDVAFLSTSSSGAGEGVGTVPSDQLHELTEAERIQRNNQRLPEGWINQRVNNVSELSSTDEQTGTNILRDESLALSRAEWENQIARHILSVYATTKVPHSSHDARAVLTYVDPKGRETMPQVKDFVFESGDPVGAAVAQAKKSNASVLAASSSAPKEFNDVGSNAAMLTQSALFDAGTSRSGQLQSRERSNEQLDVADQQALTFEPYNDNVDADVNMDSTWNAIDNSSWANTHDGFDFSDLNILPANEVPPPPVNSSAVRGNSRSGQRKDKGAHDRPARSKSPERPRFAFRALETSACLHASPNKDENDLADVAAPLSPSPFLQSKFVSGVFVFANKEGEKLIVRGPAIVSPIWFVETGDVYLDWSDLPGGEKLQANLNVLYEHRRYMEFVCLVRQVLKECYYELTNAELEPIPIRAGTLQSPTRQSVVKHFATRARSPPVEVAGGKDRFRTRLMEAGATVNIGMGIENLSQCWWRLVVTTNAMATICIEKKEYAMALNLLKKAEKWALRVEILGSNNKCQELRAYVMDTYAYYYYVHSLSMAALNFSNKAIAIYQRLNMTEGAAVGLLHIAAVECQLGKFKQSHKTLYQFLALVEDGRFGLETASARQLCSVAIAYHNLAAVQMKLQVSDLACKSSQNARKIARLCLSVSNRWLPVLQRTHELCLEDVRFRLSQRTDLQPDQKKTIVELATDLYNPAPSV